MTQVAWLFSMARCGSSVTAYASTHPWGGAVADEIFGPWDRTHAPYHYPAAQRDLMSMLHRDGERLTATSAALARDLIERIASGRDRIVVKVPHLAPTPADVARWFPEHGQAMLLRHPLSRLNSLYARGWTSSISPGYDLPRWREAARRWSQTSSRLLLEDMASDPESYFRALWTMWGWSFDSSDLDRAIDYQRRSYHEKSGAVTSIRATTRFQSESTWAVPVGAIRAYLEDPEVIQFLRSNGMPSTMAPYLARARTGGARPSTLCLVEQRVRHTRFIVRAEEARFAWRRFGHGEPPRLLDLATEGGMQLLRCHDVLPASESVGVDSTLVDGPPIELPVNCRRVVGDILRLDEAVPGETFDLITAFAALDDLEDPATAVREAARHLRPGGVLLITSPSPFWRRMLGDGAARQDVRASAVEAWCRPVGLEVRLRRRFMDPMLAMAGRRGWILDAERMSRLVPLLRRWTPPALRLNRSFVATKGLDEA